MLKGTCRDKGTRRGCGAAMLWAKTEHGGNIPLDAEPAVRNAILLDHAPGLFWMDRDVAISAKWDELDAWEGRDLYVSHFATCPFSSDHRGAPGG